MPSRPEKGSPACEPPARSGAIRHRRRQPGGVRGRARAQHSNRPRPARPPPRQSCFRCFRSCEQPARSGSIQQSLLPFPGIADYLGRWRALPAIAAVLAEVGPRLKRIRAEPRRHADRARRSDRNLEEHPVEARDRPAQAQPRTAPADRPSPSGPAGRAGRRTRDRRSPHPAQAESPQRPHLRPAHTAAERPARLEGDHPARAGRSRASHPRGPRMALRALRAAAADPRRPRHHDGPRRSRRVRHQPSALVRPSRRPSPSRSSACSAGTANATTSAPHPRRKTKDA